MNKSGFLQLDPRGLMVISAITMSLQSLLYKVLAGEIAVPLLLILRFAIPALLMWAVVVATRRRAWSFQHNRILLLRGVFLVCSQFCLFVYLIHGNVLNATLLYLSSALWVPLLSWLCYRSSLRLNNLVSVIIGFLGVVLILHPASGWLRGYVMLGILSGFFNACSQIMTHKASHTMDVLTATVGLYSFATLLAGLGVLVLYAWFPVSFTLLQAGSVWPVAIGLLLLALVGMGNQTLRIRAYAGVKDPALILPLVYLAVPVSALIDWLVYGSAPGAMGILGAALVCLGCVVTTMQKNEEQVHA